MKKITIIIFFIFVFGIFCFGQNTLPKHFVGVFQWCPFHCETVKLNTDFTFEYLIFGDMRNGRLQGTWKFVASDKIRLYGKDEEMAKVIEDFQKEGIAFEPAYPAEIDLTLSLLNKELCYFDNEGKIGYCLKKLKKKEANKLFPVKINDK